METGLRCAVGYRPDGDLDVRGRSHDLVVMLCRGRAPVRRNGIGGEVHGDCWGVGGR